MDYLRLAIGLLLPWVGGFFWLRALESRFNSAGNTHLARQIGYGYFVGLAALYCLLQASSHLIGRVPFWPMIAILVLLAGAGAAISNRYGEAYNDNSPPVNFSPTWKLIFVGLALLTTIHLALGAAEVLSLPTYPWDAWLTWTHRAKVWLYTGYLAPFATTAEWLSGSEHYSVAAAGYPEFASVIPFWAVTSLGHWSETLVNTPVTLCGLALALAMYGSCREYALGPLTSSLGTYLLISIPIIGTHLSLAGYADIWMVGFAGLGMLALIQGLIAQHRFKTIVGLVFLVSSTQVKNEGVVWLYIGLMLVIAAAVKPRYLARSLLAVAGIAALAWISGITAIDLPGLGVLGIREGHLYLPFIAPHKIHHYALLEPYKTALFQQGSWHLMAFVLSLTGLVVTFKSNERQRWILTGFVLVFALSQWLIFGFTEQGMWAESYTAINRLPMQMLPAVIFIAVVGLHLLKGAGKRPGLDRRWSALVPLGALILVTGFTLLALKPDEFTPTSPKVLVSGANMSAVMGQSTFRDGAQQVTAYQDGIAIISAGGGNVAAEHYQHLDIELFTDGHKAPSFFWRTAASPADLQILDIDEDNSILDLSGSPEWRGTIIELGVAFYEPGTESAGVKSFTLSQATLTSNALSLLDTWWATLPWTQQSVNWVQTGQVNQRWHPVALVSAWLAIAVLLALLFATFKATRSTAFATIPASIVLGWMLLDIQWLNTRVDRLEDSLETARQPGSQHFADGGDKHMAELAQAVKSLDMDTKSRIAIISQEGPGAFETERMNYHLMPLSAHPVTAGQLAGAAHPPAGILLLSKTRAPDPQWLEIQTEKLSRKFGLYKTDAIDSPYGTLLLSAND